MDAAVKAALARWPGVPDVYGWLALAARGQWLLRGEPIANPAMRAYIGRNYACDPRGAWFFQNGPQRVYVRLELAPWVYRLHPDGHLRTFTGTAARRLLGAALVDGERFAVLTELGAGCVDDRDTGHFLDALTDESGRPFDDAGLERLLAGRRPAALPAPRVGLIGPLEPLQQLSAEQLGPAFGFQRDPAPD